MGRRSRRARTIRTGNEFALAQLQTPLRTPRDMGGAVAWALEDIRRGRDAQLRGQFKLAASLAKAMRTDDALFTAYENRLAPQRAIGVKLEPADQSAAALRIADEAEGLFGVKGIGIHPETLADVTGCLANHGIAVGYNVLSPRPDGSRVDLEMRIWPIEHVRYDEVNRTLVTRVDGEHTDQPITHGDGRWTVFAKHEHEPWTQEACILPGSLVWAFHAFPRRDWARGSTAHGNAKVVGEMPPGVPLQNAEGRLTAEAQAFLQLLQAIASVDAPAGIRPSGSKTEMLVNTSSAWQVWSELVMSAEKAAARIYLGTDGMLGSVGGAPGVDIATLFGVATTKVQGDLATIERALKTGVLDIWTAINFGDSSLAPTRRYLLPDADADAERASLSKRQDAFHNDVARYRANGFLVTKELIETLAAMYAVPVPELPESPSLALASADLARVVRVNEARAAAGLGPLLLPNGAPDPDGELTLDAFTVKKAAGAAPSAPAAPKPNGAAVGSPPPS